MLELTFSILSYKSHDMLAPFTAGWQTTDVHPLIIAKSEVLKFPSTLQVPSKMADLLLMIVFLLDLGFLCV